MLSRYYQEDRRRKKKDGIEKKKTKRRRKKETKKMQIAAFWKTDSISLRLFLFFCFLPTPYLQRFDHTLTSHSTNHWRTMPTSGSRLLAYPFCLWSNFGNNLSFMSLGLWKRRAIFRFLLKPFFIKKDLVLVLSFFFPEALLSFQLPQPELVAEVVIVGGGIPRFEPK